MRFPALLRGYNAALARSPVTTKAITGGVLAFGGDLVAQRLDSVKESGQWTQQVDMR
jgi:hypothetical protein